MGGERGLTLFELVVVLAVLGLMATLAGPFLGRSNAVEVKAAARAVAATLRTARQQAIRENRPQAVIFDLDASAVETAAPARRRLPDGVRLELTTVEGEIMAGSRAGIRFFADGSSTGGRIAVIAGSVRYEVTVDWLTGAVAFHG